MVFRCVKGHEGQIPPLGWWAMVVLLLAGCSTAHYRKSADKEVYKIIDAVEQQIFGETNAFTIDTDYSQIDPESIPPEDVIEGRMATNAVALTLKDAVRLAVHQSREYQTQKEQLYLTTLSLTGSRYQFTPQFFGRVTPTLASDQNGDLSSTIGSEVGVSTLLRTGGRLSVDLFNNVLRYYTGDPANSIFSGASISFVQPLLRGFGKNAPEVEALTQAERNVVYAIRSYGLFQNTFAVGIAVDYFGLLSEKAIVRNNYTNYLRRVETVNYTEARAVDRMSKRDVEDARQQLLDARIQYVTSVASYLSRLDVFKTSLNLPLNTVVTLDDTELEELSHSGLIDVHVDRNAAFRIALEKQMEILNAIDEFEDSKRKIKVAASQLKAGLNFRADAAYDDRATPNYVDFDPSEIRYNVGLELDLPFDRLRERNEYRSTLIRFEQELRSLSLTLDDYKDRIDRGLRDLEADRLNYESRLLRLDSARRQVDMDTILLQAGRGSIRDLRESQDRLIEAQNGLTVARLAYLQTRLDLLIDIGVMQTDVAEFWLLDPLEGMLVDSQKGPTPLAMPQDEIIPPDRFLEPTL